MQIDRFVLQSEEGLPVRGTITTPDGEVRGSVLLIHGFKGFAEWGFFPWLSEELAANGFASCRFDLSRNGIGENPDIFERLDLFADDTYSVQLADVKAVLQYLEPRWRDLPLSVLGSSRGGGVAILAAVEIPALHRLVTWSAISTLDRWDEATLREWRDKGEISFLNTRTKQEMRVSTRILDDLQANRDRLDVSRAVSALRVPWLIVHGSNDETVPVAEAFALARQRADASLVIVDGATHTFGAMHPLLHVPSTLRVAFEATLKALTT